MQHKYQVRLRTKRTTMKSRTYIVTLIGLLACSLAAFAQDTNQPGTNTPPADNTVTNAAAAAPAAATTNDATAASTTVSTNETAQPAAAPTTDTTQTATSTNGTAAAPAATATTSAAATPVEASATNAAPVVPTIMMTEAPLTQAIDLLAREAKINYIIDPKVSFGPPGPQGQPAPAPIITFRWDNVTAQQALTTLLATYSLQLVEDPKTTIARITIKDPAAPDPLFTKVIQLKYTGVSNIVDSVRTVLVDPKRSKVAVDTRTSQLVVVATEKEISSIDNLVERLDTPTRQVLIEAKLLETTLNPSTFKGIDWTGTLRAQNLAFGNNLQVNPPQQSVNNTLSQSLPKALFDTAKGFNPATAFLDADGVNAVFSFINENSDARILSSPRTVTLDNEMAKIDVTRATPIINVTAGTANTTGGSQITYTNLGIIMDVTPRITANNYVNLKVIPEVSRIFDTVTKVVQGAVFQADEYDIRRLQTQVMIPSGNTLVLGGLMQDDQSESGTKVPILGDIPGLGAAFRSNSKTRQKDNLIVFITPTIVEDSDFHPTHTDFLQSPVETTEGKDWSAWDSAKPADWSAMFHHKSSN
jgi:type II secretory pathway component GspD/PulD (secretin)